MFFEEVRIVFMKINKIFLHEQNNYLRRPIILRKLDCSVLFIFQRDSNTHVNNLFALTSIHYQYVLGLRGQSCLPKLFY